MDTEETVNESKIRIYFRKEKTKKNFDTKTNGFRKLEYKESRVSDRTQHSIKYDGMNFQKI